MSNPLNFSYALGNQGVIKTSVSGDNRDVAAITLLNVNTQLYFTTLNNIQLIATTPNDIAIGSLKILKGATFTLTIPSNTQLGTVFFNCLIQSGDNNPTQFSAQVANWQLSS